VSLVYSKNIYSEPVPRVQRGIAAGKRQAARLYLECDHHVEGPEAVEVTGEVQHSAVSHEPHFGRASGVPPWEPLRGRPAPRVPPPPAQKEARPAVETQKQLVAKQGTPSFLHTGGVCRCSALSLLDWGVRCL